MTQKFPLFTNIKSTLMRWRIELTSLADLEANLIEVIKWKSWEPTFTASGTMTFTVSSISYAKYIEVGKATFFNIRADGTTGGVASTEIRFTLPTRISSTNVVSFASTIVSGGFSLAGRALHRIGDEVAVGRYDGANWAIGANQLISVSGFYEIV